MTPVRITRALISVSDKTGLVEFARRLSARGIDILSTGGTHALLRDAGIPARSVTAVTGFPEILDGRVKTLHPKIHGGLLGIPDHPVHRREMDEHGIEPIDLLVVNLYPFEATVTDPAVRLEDAIEQIDIGGPAMLRAAAKNCRCKTVLCDPAQYTGFLEELEQSGGSISWKTRFRLAQEAFLHTARYDSAIGGWLSGQISPADRPVLPEVYTLVLPKAEQLRYGENPHQQAALYGNFHAFFTKLHGKDLSYNNLVDIQAAVELVEGFAEPAAAIIKHTNPCGVGTGAHPAEAYRKAFATDQKSAFGGIVAFNRPLDMEAVRAIDAVFTEVVIARDFPAEVLDTLKKKKDRRLIIQRRALAGSTGLAVRQIAGGMLVQTADQQMYRDEELRVVTRRSPGAEERAAMEFAWRVAKYVKSNAIVYAKADRTLGIGAGQMSRIDSARIAVLKAREAGLPLEGCAVASDAFFPFADGLLEAVAAGATAVIQPGGSIRDEEVISAADDNNIAMIMTGTRHFKH
ncbi:MAG TPA: bifunctional phosphoribosylaminoimidazolecarboxamide formyltransferase/IMP cyclohydrolase [Bacteroidota bacterium]|nr:bifunctional phosphoribosylaminoimidazolecarboxamide formyltransferase/IMP cyclohydrolase [Bacteroidota bacterium]